MKTASEKAMIKVQAKKVIDKIDCKKLGKEIAAKIADYKAQKKVSKAGKILTGLPARNIGINKQIIDHFKTPPEVAFEVVRLVGETSGAYVVGYAPFGALLYLPEDYTGNTAVSVDFSSCFK